MTKPSETPSVEKTAPKTSVRSLAGDIVLVYMIFAILVGVMSVGGLWWMSHRIIEDNLNKWGVEWVMKLDALGAPLYVAPSREEFSRVESYIGHLREFAFVRYYTDTGELFHGIYADSQDEHDTLALLSATELEKLRDLGPEDAPLLVNESTGSLHILRVSKPLWAESIVSDGLIGFDPFGEEDEKRELLGFVELGLNFAAYESEMDSRMLRASLVLALVLLFLGILARLSISRALRPLSELEEPLTKLAAGEMNIDLDASGHSEIMTINNALVSTIAALQERDERLRRIANYDALTGLMSRHCFEQELTLETEVVARSGSVSALLFVDLDQFKYVNDTWGHAAGDRLLAQIATNLKAIVRKSDTLCRFGGDEFIILASNMDRDGAEHLAASIVESIGESCFFEEGHSFDVRCSVGVTLIGCADFTGEQLLAQADMACHEAKSRGRNRYHFHATANKEKAVADMGWSRRIKEALQKDGFEFHYQPIVDVETGEPVLYEVLLRMKGDGPKIITPGAFLPAAHRFGLMVEVDYWVIDHAIEALAGFHASGKKITMALNLAGSVFESPGVVDHVRRALSAHDLPPASLIIEITEQVAVRQLLEARGAIHELRELGCGFALDDFGAGFSSFNYLKQLPMDYLKIDGTFIENLANDPTDQAVVRSIIQIAHAVGMKTVAEYVRDAASLELLRDFGVDLAQGYFIGKPRKGLVKGSPVCPPAKSLSKSRV